MYKAETDKRRVIVLLTREENSAQNVKPPKKHNKVIGKIKRSTMPEPLLLIPIW